jgi:hypothetical protein
MNKNYFGKNQKTIFLEKSINTNEFSDLVGPILLCSGFKRLGSISFLGILSPRYAELANNPIYSRPTVKLNQITQDGSRADHSYGVALLAQKICKEIGLTAEQQKYAAAWGLLHDLGNWALSHTAQHAFSELLGVKTKTVREWLVISDSRVPQKYTITQELCACGIDPERMLGLFQKRPDKDLEIVHSILRSKLTPDMLEGVWRSGQAFGVETLNPNEFITAWYPDLANDYALCNTHKLKAIQFWHTKQEIYRRFFSSKSVVRFENHWSAAVFDFFKNRSLTLEQSFEIDEQKLVEEITKYVSRTTKEVLRWKPPIRQRINKPYPKTFTLKSLDKILIEESIRVDEYT